MSTITRPILRARSCCGWGTKARNASISPWTNSSIGLATSSVVTQLMSFCGSSPTCAAMIDTYSCWVAPGPSSMPTCLPFRSVKVRMCSCTNSSKQPGCTPASTVIGTPASRRRTAPGANMRPKSISPRSNAWVTQDRLHGDIADVGEPFRRQQLLGHVLRRDADRVFDPSIDSLKSRVMADADRGHLRRPLVGERGPGAEDAGGAGRRQRWPGNRGDFA